MEWTDSILIGASADVVWRLTIGVTDWPSFNPTMQKVERLDTGPVEVGSTARIKQPGQKPAVWTVTVVEPGRLFAWQTRRLGLVMTGSHLVESVGDSCRNTLTLEVSGPVARPFGAFFGLAVRRSLQTENASFKSEAESAPTD